MFSQNTARKLEKLRSIKALLGYVLLGWKPIEWFIEKVGEVDTIRDHCDQVVAMLMYVWAFLNTTLGYVFTFTAGIAYLAYLIVRDDTSRNAVEEVPLSKGGEQWRALTGTELTGFIDALSERQQTQRARVEIVSTVNSKIVADALLSSLTALKYNVKLFSNVASADSPAEPQAPGIIVRYLPTTMNGGLTGESVLRGLLRAALIPQPEKFIDNEKYYSLVRIEIGDWLSGSQRRPLSDARITHGE